jgi:hypothetical protein
MIARVQSERDSESDRDGTDERDASGHNSKKRKIKNVSPKTDRFKVRSLREFGYSKRSIKHDEDDNSEDYKPPSVNRKPKSSRENKNNRDVSDISIILAALDNEF